MKKVILGIVFVVIYILLAIFLSHYLLNDVNDILKTVCIGLLAALLMNVYVIKIFRKK